jgi:hypothetical protein
LISYLHPSPYTYVTSASLISPEADRDLSKLEADTIISSIASSILPPHIPRVIPAQSQSQSQGQGKSKGKGKDQVARAEPEKALPTGAAEEVVEEFRSEDAGDPGTRRREWLGWVVGVAGAVVWLGVEGTRGIRDGQWTRGIFPVSYMSDLPRRKSLSTCLTRRISGDCGRASSTRTRLSTLGS